ncbi:hypothetical protein BDZ45DRAFT_486752 [Acephala macrosclerotiorum]|nr:hypothetical protein BDZ45DRAFT_486752 [Acephala macrosclerotiorum]
MTQIFSKLEINDDAFLSRFARSWCAESCVSAFEDSSSTVPQLEQVDFTWISHMVDYRAWSHTFVSGILYVVYDDISGWAINVARELERDIGGSEIGRKLFYYYDPFAFGPGPKKWLGSSGPFSYEADMARSLICQIFAGDSGCISAVDLQQREIQKHPVDYWQDEKRDENGRLIQWKLSLSNPDTAWQHLWSLLACAIRAIKQDVILMLVGLQSHECYVAFRNGLKYLKAAFPNKASNYSDISLPSLSFLVLGEPDSMTVDRPPIKVDFSACIRKTKEILDCLNSLYFRELSARRDLVKSAITGTNDWIWHHPVYERWKGSSSSLLWIYGKAASGKSTLAATLQRLLSINAKELEEGGASYNVADFFYSSRGGPTETSHQFMLRSILYQLLQRDNSLWQCFRETFRARRKACDENIVWSFDDLRQILLNISRSSPNPRSKGRTTRRFLLILDGIDESEERTPGGQRRQKVLSLLTSICSPNYSTIFKIIALSRVEDDLSRVLRTPNHIDMKDVNGPDIEKIISAGIAKLWSHMSQTEDISNQDSDSSSSSGNTIRSIKSAQNHQLINRSAYANYRTKSTGSDYLALSDTSELDFIREYLRAHAHGVILWVILIIRRLVKAVKSQTYTFKQLRTLLSSLPTTLNESYQSMVQKIGDKKDTLDQARYVIAWTLFSKRPLRVKEIRDAIAMFHWQQPTSEQETDFLYMNRVGQLTSSWVPIQTLIWNICGGFIEIVPSDPDAVKCFWKPQPIIGDDYVQLIHESAKEFLFFDEKATFLDLNQNKWDQKISRNLAAYVKMSFSWNYRGEDILRGKGIKSWTTPEFKVWIDLLEDRPLLEYAISQLKGHLDSDAPLETSEEQQIWETVQLCLQGCSNTPETLLYLLLQGWAEKQLQLFRPEFTMNLMPPNLDSESNESSLIDSVSPDPDSGNNRSSLIDPVSPNLDSGNDKSSLTNPVPPSPLSTSSISVSTMAPVMFLKTSLLVGCKLGAVEAVRVLLAAATVAGIEKIYDTDSSGLWGIFPEDTESLGTAPPLCVAVEGGHYLVVRLLLNAGANPAAVNSAGYSALDLAILGRHFSAAQEILRGVESKDMEKLFGHSWGRLKTLRERLKTSRAIFERSDRKVSSSSKYTGTSLQGGKP